MTRIAVAVGMCALVTAIPFQANPRAITLRPPDATLGEPFASIYSIRELADGRLLISDFSQDNRLVVADLNSGRVRMVGHVGAGPGEYRQAGRLFALPGDSTLFIDSPARGRWWLILHNDTIIRNLPPDLPALRVVGGSPAGADSTGRVLGVRQAGADRVSNNINRGKEVAVIGNRNDAAADTVARLRGYESQWTQTGTRDRPFYVVRQLSGSASEQALMFLDGWVAFVRLEPYRVEWLTPAGTLVRGPEIPWEWPRADARERAAAVERHKRRYGDRNVQQLADDPWAARLAPIRGGALMAAPNGHLLVLRAQWSQAMDTNYDLFDRTGRRIATLALPDSERIVGFGSRSAYVSVRDGDGFHYLRRHPWP